VSHARTGSSQKFSLPWRSEISFSTLICLPSMANKYKRDESCCSMCLSSRKGTVHCALQTESCYSKFQLCASITLLNQNLLHLYNLPYQTTAESQLTPSSEADIQLVSQEFFRLSHNTKIHYRVHNGQQPVSNPSHPNSVHTLYPISLTAIFLLSPHLCPGAKCGTFPSNWD
jgi:hypothetical protein